MWPPRRAATWLSGQSWSGCISETKYAFAAPPHPIGQRLEICRVRLLMLAKYLVFRFGEYRRDVPGLWATPRCRPSATAHLGPRVPAKAEPQCRLQSLHVRALLDRPASNGPPTWSLPRGLVLRPALQNPQYLLA